MKRPWTLPTETWEVPATPVMPLGQVEDRVLLHLARTWGRLGRVAMCKFVSVLPEIQRRGLFRKAGYGSIYELAAKMGSLSREVVDSILRLHGFIGRYECLWGLLSEGVVGWSKLSKIEDLVTPETAGWFARFVQEAPKSEIERLAARTRVRLRQLSGDPARSVGSKARDAHLTTALLEESRQDAKASEDRSAAKAGETPRDLEEGPSAGCSSAASERVREPHVSATAGPAAGGSSCVRDSVCPPGSPVDSECQAGIQGTLLREMSANSPSQATSTPGGVACEDSAASPFPTTSGPGSAACDGAGSSPLGPDQAAAAAAAEGSASSGWADLGEDFLPAGPKRTSLELSPFCRELAVRLQAEYRLRGVTVSLGELVELAFRVVWASGRFPLPNEAPAAIDPPAEIAATVAASPTPVDAGRPEGGCGSAGSKPERESAERPEDVAGIGPCGSGAVPRSLPISQHKVLAVVISVAETGQNWMRTLGGVIPVRLADLSGLAPVVEVVTLAEVTRRLEIKAAESRGKGILTDTRLFVAATSGLHCQARDCDQPVAHVHHDKPKAEGPDHGPANTYGVCERCHAARHGGLVLNPDAHPGDWVIVEPSQRPDPNRVDRACQALRQQALAAGFRVA